MDTFVIVIVSWLTTKIWKMSSEDWMAIYREMKRVFARDKELTNIVIDFSIKPVTDEKKIAKINVKTYHDEHRVN